MVLTIVRSIKVVIYMYLYIVLDSELEFLMTKKYFFPVQWQKLEKNKAKRANSYMSLMCDHIY